MIHNGLSILILLVQLTACNLNTNWKKPDIPFQNWHSVSSDKNIKINHVWWEQFKDDKLNKLITNAQSKSPDIKIALARIAQARALESSAIADKLPNISANTNINRSRSSATTSNRPAYIPSYNTLYNAGFDASWEVDLFGIKPALRAAKTQTNITRVNYDAAMITLAGDIARSYFTIRMAQAQIATTRKNINAQEKTVSLTRDLAKAGKMNMLDVAEAESLRNATRATLPPLQAILEESMYQLDVLSGLPPGALEKELSISANIYIPTPDSVLAAPSAVLAARPDVRAAEENLIYTAALHDTALAQYFPKIPLTALLGVQSSHTNLLFNNPSRTWSIAGGLAVPIFDFGRIRAQVKQSDEFGQESLAQYEKTILNALNDIESALVAYESEKLHYAALGDSVKSSKLSVTLSKERYSKGLSSYLDLLVAQKALFEAETYSAQSQLQLCINLVRLYKALD